MSEPPSSGVPLTLASDDKFATGAHVSLHFLGQEGVLFDARAQRLYALNTAGVFIWCLAEEGMGAGAIAARMSGAFGLPAAESLGHVESAFARWRELELELGPASAPPTGAASLAPAAAAPADDLDVDHSLAVERRYRLLDHDIALRGSQLATLDELHHFLAPLAVPAPPATDAPPALTFDIVEDDGCFAVLREGIVAHRWLRADEVIPAMKRALVEAALAQSGDFGALHAAGICGRNDDCTLLIGASGSGKSTLTAALMAAGLRILGDDTIVLAGETLQARPVPFGIGLKEGAWYLLAERFPMLAEQPIYRRQDGLGVRYLSPPPGDIWMPPPLCPVRNLIFLERHNHVEPATLAPLPPPQALRQLVGEFCPLGEGLTADKVDRLVHWIGSIDCHVLRFAELDDGVAAIQSICR